MFVGAIIVNSPGVFVIAYQPLADALRPKSLDDVVGQGHMLAKSGLLRRIIEGGSIPNMIFYGPSGTGKTTVAEIVAKRIERPFHRLNATTASIADIRSIMDDIGTLLAPQGVVLYLDEIQYFNKKQQQSLLEFMENGTITLIASTTENPYFYVYNAVLSRATVFEFKPIAPKDVRPALARAIAWLASEQGLTVTCEEGVLDDISHACGGDVRKALNALEALCAAHRADGTHFTINSDEVRLVAQRSAMRYDRDGDSHYDILSALQKSIRGSDVDAGLHYLARLLEAGDLISACRRLLVIAAEDVGLAYPQAIAIVKSCIDAANMLGLPEAQIPLAEAVILMATAPKSNTAYRAIGAARADIQNGKSGEIPRQLQNKHADGVGLPKGQHYKYPHDFPNGYVPQQYLPNELAGAHYYTYGNNKTEQAARRYWEEIKGK